jgi:hypothetical protein
VERKKMTPREFVLWWDENDLTEEYEKAQSETKKRRLLEEWGVPDMYEEAERQLWLKKILDDYGQEDIEKSAPRSEKEFNERFHQFGLYLRNLQLRDYEWEWFGKHYVTGLAIDAVLENTHHSMRSRGKIPKDVKEEFEKLGILERIGVTS